MRVFSLQIMKEDFERPYGFCLMRLLEKYDKYGLTYRDNKNINYYLKRLKEEIEEFEKNPDFDEARDIANFALMLVYHLQPKKKGTESS